MRTETFKCQECGLSFNKAKTGQASKVCSLCYPLYKKAYNLCHAARYRAEEKNLLFDLEVSWVFKQLKNNRCAVTDLPFQISGINDAPPGRHSLSPSIDRIDPLKGYTKDNCRLVIWWYNIAKQQHNDLSTWHLCKKVVDSLEEKLVQNVF